MNEFSLASKIDPSVLPLETDAWVSNSLLQKSIRRGEEHTAQRAALTFLAARGSAIWRRFIIVAFEDIGAANPQTVSLVVRVGIDRAWRKSLASDQTVACNLASILARDIKNRSAEHLITVARHHYSAIDGTELNTCSLSNILFEALDSSKSPALRARAFWRASGLGWPEQTDNAAQLSKLMSACRNAGVPFELVGSTQAAISRVADPILPMASLAWLLAGRSRQATEHSVPVSLDLFGIPSYALDKHTLMGRRAIRELVKCSGEIRSSLARYVSRSSWNDAAYMAAFYTDASPLRRKMTWEGAEELERLAIEADLMRMGVAENGVDPLLEAFRKNLDRLNDLRSQVFFKKQSHVGAAEPLLLKDGGGA